MTSNEITSRQNEEAMLRVQFAARKYYNTAETIDTWLWLACFITWLTLLIPTTGLWNTVTICTVTALDILIGILSWRISANVKKGSSLRAYFDAYVLDISPAQYSKSDSQELEELAQDAEAKYPKEYSVQIVNTGHDTPPGVRNWYEFSQPSNGLPAIFICQQQNNWWTKNVARTKYLISIVTSVLFLGLFVLVAYWALPGKGFLQVFLSAIGILTKVIGRIAARIQYQRLTDQLSGAAKMLEVNLTPSGIECLQKLIDKRRALPVLESNLIHKLKANFLSKKYLKLPQ